MGQSAYITTITFVFEGDQFNNANDVADMISETFNPWTHLAEDMALLDWGYHRSGIHLLTPQRVTVSKPYNEGDAFNGH